MKVGDKKQAVVLGFVALAALVFLVKQVMPSGAPAIVAKLLRESEPPKPESLETLPEYVTRDAFTHPALFAEPSRNEAAKPEGEAKSVGKPTAKVEVQPATITGKLPELESIPEENTGISQKEDQKPKLTLKLVGVIDMGRPVACIEIGKHVREAESGQRIAEGVKVLRIGGSEVLVRVNGANRSLALGKEVSL